MNRLKTDMGKKLAHAQSIISTTWDNWWLENYKE